MAVRMKEAFQMSTAYVIVTLLAAVLVGFSAASAFARAQWVVQPLTDYGVPRSWLPWLATAKAAGAAGLVVGLFVPLLGVIAAICLILYFTGAVITVVRARWYSHLAFPLLYVAPVIAALALGSIPG
jgi:DoxX-like family